MWYSDITVGYDVCQTVIRSLNLFSKLQVG